MSIKLDENGRFELDKLKDLIDTSKVVYYSTKLSKDKTIELKFYDKNQKLVHPNPEVWYYLTFNSSDLVFYSFEERYKTLKELHENLDGYKSKYKDYSYKILKGCEIDRGHS